MKACDNDGCRSTVGRGRKYCPGCRTADTPDYDPRFDRAQTIDGAKARYVADDLPEYDIQMLEADVDRILRGGENPDATARTDARECLLLGGERVF
jgi:hypothetical protein